MDFDELKVSPLSSFHGASCLPLTWSWPCDWRRHRLVAPARRGNQNVAKHGGLSDSKQHSTRVGWLADRLASDAMLILTRNQVWSIFGRAPSDCWSSWKLIIQEKLIASLARPSSIYYFLTLIFRRSLPWDGITLLYFSPAMWLGKTILVFALKHFGWICRVSLKRYKMRGRNRSTHRTTFCACMWNYYVLAKLSSYGGDSPWETSPTNRDC